jgi:hypothetical protein
MKILSVALRLFHAYRQTGRSNLTGCSQGYNYAYNRNRIEEFQKYFERIYGFK